MPEITSFLGCFFTLKIQKKVLRQSQKCPNPLGTTRQTPCGVENHICDHFLGYFAQNNPVSHFCPTCPKIGQNTPGINKNGNAINLLNAFYTFVDPSSYAVNLLNACVEILFP